MDLPNEIYVRRKGDFMSESFLFVIVIIYLAINHLYSRPKENYLIANRRIE